MHVLRDYHHISAVSNLLSTYFRKLHPSAPFLTERQYQCNDMSGKPHVNIYAKLLLDVVTLSKALVIVIVIVIVIFILQQHENIYKHN